jgi:hypothetical protein
MFKVVSYNLVRLYYLDEASGPTRYVRSALGVDEDVWSEAFLQIRDWRKEVMRQYKIPLYKELHASDLLALRGELVKEQGKYRRLADIKDAVNIYISGLQRLEKLAKSLSGSLEIINVSMPKSPKKIREEDTLDRILNRIEASVRNKARAFLIFDEGNEKKIAYYYRKMRVYNPVPSKFGKWETGEQWKNIPIKDIIGGPAFRNSAGDYFLQMVDFVAYALLKQDEVNKDRHKVPPRIKRYNIDKAFGLLDSALNKNASKSDSQGVVRN